MEKALEFLKTHRDVALATVEGDRPKIRNVELLAMDGDISVRVTGRACFDVTDDIARRIYEGNEVLRRLYPGYKTMVYFRLPVIAVDYYDLAPTPPVLEHWER